MLCNTSSRPPSMVTSLLAQLRTLDHEVVDLRPRVAGVAVANGFWLLDHDFGIFDRRAGRQQPEGEADRVAIDARQSADAQLQPQHPAVLAGPIQFPST